MKPNHLNLTVTDVLAAVAFLETYFGFARQGGNAGMALLADSGDDGDMFLTLMKTMASTWNRGSTSGSSSRAARRSIA